MYYAFSASAASLAGVIPTRLPFSPMRASLTHLRLSLLLPPSPRRLFSLHNHIVSQHPIPLVTSRRSLAMTVNNLRPRSPISTSSTHKLDADDEFWMHVEANGSTPGHYVYSKPIHKSEQDDREYRAIRLENGLQALLVHDAKTDKAAASLDVAVGHLSDPVSGSVFFCVAPMRSLASGRYGLMCGGMFLSRRITGEAFCQRSHVHRYQ